MLRTSSCRIVPRLQEPWYLSGSPPNGLVSSSHRPILEGLSVDRAPFFDNWLAGQRHRFGQLRQQLLERLSVDLPPESDDRIEVLRERTEVARFDEVAHIAHIALIHTLF
jgi:hypothetical protein